MLVDVELYCALYTDSGAQRRYYDGLLLRGCARGSNAVEVCDQLFLLSTIYIQTMKIYILPCPQNLHQMLITSLNNMWGCGLRVATAVLLLLCARHNECMLSCRKAGHEMDYHLNFGLSSHIQKVIDYSHVLFYILLWFIHQLLPLSSTKKLRILLTFQREPTPMCWTIRFCLFYKCWHLYNKMPTMHGCDSVLHICLPEPQDFSERLGSWMSRVVVERRPDTCCAIGLFYLTVQGRMQHLSRLKKNVNCSIF